MISKEIYYDLPCCIASLGLDVDKKWLEQVNLICFSPRNQSNNKLHSISIFLTMVDNCIQDEGRIFKYFIFTLESIKRLFIVFQKKKNVSDSLQIQP